MGTEVVRLCDVPACEKRGRTVEHYEVDMPGGVLRTDLCRDHAKPLNELVRSLPQHLFTRISNSDTRARQTGFHKVTMEDIERLHEQ